MGMNDALIPLSNGGMSMGGPARASFLNIMHYFNREHHFYCITIIIIKLHNLFTGLGCVVL